MPRALITGITGQTGGYLAEELLDQGWDVHGFVRLSPASGHAADRSGDVDGRCLLHYGDLTDAPRLAEVVAEVEPDTVFNLGGQTSVAASWDEPLLTSSVTATPVAALIDASRRLQDRLGRSVSFVQASSAEIFEPTAPPPQSEMTRIAPHNPYGAAKAYGHHLVGAYRAAGLAASSCILFNHESPRRPARFVTRKITSGVARIRLGRARELRLGNLDAVRDWGWAPDYAHALALAAAQPDDYVIATGEGHSVEEFVALAFASADIEDWRSHVVQDEAFLRPTDAAAQIGDASRARARLGWHPTKDLAAVIAEMVEHDLEVEGSR